MTHDNDTTTVIGATGKTGRRVADGCGDATCRYAPRPDRAHRRSTGPTTPRGPRRCRAPRPPTSRTSPTSPCPVRPRRSPPSPRWRWPPAPGGSCCCRAGARRRRSAPSRCSPASGADWTVLRASWFIRTSARAISSSRCSPARWRCRPATCGEPFVDVDDIAEVAVAVLTEAGHVGRTYELTGPRLLTFAQAVARSPRRPGAAMRYVPIPPAELAAGAGRRRVCPTTVVDLALLPVRRGARRPQRHGRRRRPAGARPARPATSPTSPATPPPRASGSGVPA